MAARAAAAHHIGSAVAVGCPFAAAGLTGGNAQFVGVEAGPAKRLVDVTDRDVECVDLGERHLAAIESGSDPLALPEQPVRIAFVTAHAFLRFRRIVARERSETARGTPHEHPFGAEHCAVGIDADTSIGGTERVEPPHLLDHEAAGIDKTLDDWNIKRTKCQLLCRRSGSRIGGSRPAPG